MAEHRVLSADAHILEPPDLWTSRMDPKYGDLIPHLVHKESFDHFHSGEQHWGLLAAMGGANAGMRRNPGTAQEEGSRRQVFCRSPRCLRSSRSYQGRGRRRDIW